MFNFANGSGPVISPAAKDRIRGLITQSVEEGAEILLDGRDAKVDGLPKGNWVGPTVLKGPKDNVGYK